MYVGVSVCVWVCVAYAESGTYLQPLVGLQVRGVQSGVSPGSAFARRQVLQRNVCP